jgi:predicted AlkP superfamily phosphohydrolase/phosphomutase
VALAKKVAVIGLDCAPPELVFEQWWDELPTLRALADQGAWGKLHSVCPPITVPAWSCMMSGKDPGQLGIYGFRNRKDYSYDGMTIANATAVREPRVWDVLSRAGKKVIVMCVPGTYPTSAVNGAMVSCFLTPNAQSSYTYPPELKSELEKKFGPYMIDVENFRSEDKDRILDNIYKMTEQHFAMAHHMVTTHPWDFFMMVEMGTDRIHHAFWKFHDKNHRKFEPGNKYENSIREYYHFIDKKIAELIPALGDDTTLFVVSDHGAKSMQGGICVNEWLMQNGYLSLKQPLSAPTPIGKAPVDWTKTIAWGEGGYYSRLFLNVKGREPNGVIEPSKYEAMRDELKAKLEAMLDDQGQPLGTRVFKPQEVYRSVRNVAPDLIVYFGNLSWRSVGMLGTGAVHTFENDTGPDDANHAEYGIIILREPNGARGVKLEGAKLLDVSGMILDRFGLRDANAERRDSGPHDATRAPSTANV